LNPRLLRCERRRSDGLHKRASMPIKLAIDLPPATANTVRYHPYWHDSGTTAGGRNPPSPSPKPPGARLAPFDVHEHRRHSVSTKSSQRLAPRRPTGGAVYRPSHEFRRAHLGRQVLHQRSVRARIGKCSEGTLIDPD
jgi:hypothetical protein